MGNYPYEELYDDYEEEEEIVEALPPPRHSKRPAFQSVPLRKTRVERLQAKDDLNALFPERHTRQEQLAARSTQNVPAAAPSRSHISHTALQVAVKGDQRVGRSQLRYVDEQGRQVWREGNRQLVFHTEPPPPRNRPRVHWLLWSGLGMLFMIGLVVGFNAAAAAIQAHNLDSKYGNPRTWQTDAVVGHNDSAAHPSHFVFENLHGKIIIDEYPGGDISHAIVYSGGGIYSDQLPVTGSFEDVRHDGRPDMLVQIGTDTPNTETIIFTNNGKQFVPPT